MNNIKTILLLFAAFAFTQCSIDEISDPNGPVIGDFREDVTRSGLQNLVSGVEDLARKEIGFYYDVTSIIGREYWYFTGSDPRYTGELLGKGGSQLDNAGFYGTRPYAGRYRTIRTANLLIDAAENSTVINDEERNSLLGFAKTIQALEYQYVLNLQYENGIRIDVEDPDNLGPFESYENALSAISDLLDEAYDHLNNGGDEFPFVLSSAMAGYANPASFGEFNRALKARVAIYQNDKTSALTALENSFMILDNVSDLGPARFYSTAGGDQTNLVFRPRNQADAIIAHPSFIDDAEANDTRLSKVQERDESNSLDGLTGNYDVWVFQSNTAFIPFINNDELVLLYAEANIGTNNSEAVTALNIIRNGAGIGDYSGDTDDDSLVDEMLNQRRYSLYGLGHRWVDMRRYNRLDQLPIDRVDDDVWTQFPRPVSENE